MSSNSSPPSQTLDIESDWNGTVRPLPITADALAPPEVWDVCWCHVDESDYLRALSLTCRVFRDLAQPLLFECLAFTGLDRNKAPTKPVKASFRRLRDRLKALAQSPLRNSVRRIFLVDWTAGNTDSTLWETTQTLFQTIATFANLRTANCLGVNMLSVHFQNLCGRTNLRHLELVACQWPWDDALPYRLAQVEVLCNSDQSIVTSCLGIMNPEYLCKLTLSLPGNDKSDLFMVPFLRRCPALSHLELLYFSALRFGTPALDLSYLNSGDLPRLAFYAGPAQTITSIISGRPVCHLKFAYPLDATTLLSVGAVEPSFDAIAPAARAQITELTLLLGRRKLSEEVSARVHETLKAWFPNLRQVHRGE